MTSKKNNEKPLVKGESRTWAELDAALKKHGTSLPERIEALRAIEWPPSFAPDDGWPPPAAIANHMRRSHCQDDGPEAEWLMRLETPEA